MASVDYEEISVALPSSQMPGWDLSDLLTDAIINKHVQDDRSDLLDWWLLDPYLSDRLLQRLSEQSKFATILGHRKEPRWLLEKLAKRGQSEAIITVAKALYTSPDDSALALRSFLQEHLSDPWMLGTLARITPSSPDKERVYLEEIASHPDRNAWIALIEERNHEREARESTDRENLARLYRTNSPRVLRALAGNLCTPEHILRDLSHSNGIKFAPRSAPWRKRACCGLGTSTPERMITDQHECSQIGSRDMPVLIRKSVASDGAGTWYSIENFQSYVEALRAKGIDTPRAKYRIFIPADVEHQYRRVHGDIESQVALFYRLGDSSGIHFEIVGP